MNTKLLIFLSLVFFTSCKSDLILLNQKVYFEMHSANSAWGFHNSGYVIDSAGNVLSFELSQKSYAWNEPDSLGFITSEAMNINVSRCNSVIQKLNADSLALYVRKIPAASLGKISKPKQVMADAGSISYSAYIYDAKKDRYKRVLLKMWGDWMITNDAPEAQQLYLWMSKLGVK